MMEYRVWYHPYLYWDEEDYVDVVADSEQAARSRGAAYGWVTDVEIRR